MPNTDQHTAYSWYTGTDNYGKVFYAGEVTESLKILSLNQPPLARKKEER